MVDKNVETSSFNFLAKGPIFSLVSSSLWTKNSWEPRLFNLLKDFCLNHHNACSYTPDFFKPPGFRLCVNEASPDNVGIEIPRRRSGLHQFLRHDIRCHHRLIPHQQLMQSPDWESLISINKQSVRGFVFQRHTNRTLASLTDKSISNVDKGCCIRRTTLWRKPKS